MSFSITKGEVAWRSTPSLDRFCPVCPHFLVPVRRGPSARERPQAASRCTEITASPAAWLNHTDVALPVCRKPALKRPRTPLDPDDTAPLAPPGLLPCHLLTSTRGATPHMTLHPPSPLSFLSAPSYHGSPTPPALALVAGHLSADSVCEQ